MYLRSIFMQNPPIHRFLCSAGSAQPISRRAFGLRFVQYAVLGAGDDRLFGVAKVRSKAVGTLLLHPMLEAVDPICVDLRALIIACTFGKK